MITVAIIQARLGSRRFPRKALADLEGHPLIWHVCTRVREVKSLDRIILACPPADREAFTSLSLPCDVLAPDVPEEDVLARFAAITADLEAGDKVVRITGDCPALSPEALALTVQTLEGSRYDDYWCFATSEHEASGWPDGTGCEAFWADRLRVAAKEATWPRDREHVTRWMARHHMPLVVVNHHGDFGHLKLSVDTPEDLTAVREYLRRYTAGGAYVGAP